MSLDGNLFSYTRPKSITGNLSPTQPKLVCGGRFFTNPNRPDKRPPVEVAFGESMGACRGFTLCETFKDWDDCSFKFFEITCPECMESDIYRKWLRRLTVLRLKTNSVGSGMTRWDYRFHRDVRVSTYIDNNQRELDGGPIYE